MLAPMRMFKRNCGMRIIAESSLFRMRLACSRRWLTHDGRYAVGRLMMTQLFVIISLLHPRWCGPRNQLYTVGLQHTKAWLTMPTQRPEP